VFLESHSEAAQPRGSRKTARDSVTLAVFLHALHGVVTVDLYRTDNDVGPLDAVFNEAFSTSAVPVMTMERATHHLD
jgi:hypothetical protein